eukprot:TRINITY_DN15876_c0_g1_i1.p1 TRINITY_DN15876_c0_g1~~TRINITY_DN15876_c0_g1_i1.p1  ORF type:complete len:463 (-),score=85.68 TRINITY_DN15876_c0_g1_i1:59-1447(-)
MPHFSPFSALKEKITKKAEEHLLDPKKVKKDDKKVKKTELASNFFQKLQKELPWNEIDFNGTLIVSILAANDLLRETHFGIVDSDPYVIIFVDGVEKARTSVQKGLNVVFKEYFEIPITGKHKDLALCVMDSDAFKEDDFRGEVHVSFKDIWEKKLIKGPTSLGPKLTPKTLTNVPVNTSIQGKLDYTVTFRPATVDGHLKLHIDRVDKVERHDKLGLGKSDPYVVFLLDSTVLGRTPVVKSGIWDQTFDLDIAGEYSNLYVSLWDKDTLTSDDYLGHVTIPTKDLVAKKTIGGDFTYHKQKETEDSLKPKGSLRLNASWRPPILNGRVSIMIEKANDLLEVPGWGIPLLSYSLQPFVEILLDGESMGKTKAVKSRNPEWNERFEFTTDGPHQVLEVVVWDSDGWIYSGGSLGYLRVSTQQLVVQKTVQGEFYLIPYKTSNASGTLKILASYTPKITPINET